VLILISLIFLFFLTSERQVSAKKDGRTTGEDEEALQKSF